MACANIVSSTVQRRRNAIGLGKTLVDDPSNAPGVNGLRIQRAAPSSSAIRRKSGAGGIADIDGLRKTSCECYLAVQTQCDRLLNATGA